MRGVLLLIAIVAAIGTVVAGYAGGVRGVLLFTDVVRGRSALAILNCTYLGGPGTFTVAFARSPESVVRCPRLATFSG
jgi:hypothetical protein